jgi:hypothetical protein
MNGARDRKIIDHQDEPSSGTPLRQEQASYGGYTTANVVKELMTTEKWPRHPNLRRRPHSPNKGKGRLQRQIARAFAVGGPVLSSSQVYDWAFARKRKLSQLRRHGVWRIPWRGACGRSDLNVLGGTPKKIEGFDRAATVDSLGRWREQKGRARPRCLHRGACANCQRVDRRWPERVRRVLGSRGPFRLCSQRKPAL